MTVLALNFTSPLLGALFLALLIIACSLSPSQWSITAIIKLGWFSQDYISWALVILCLLIRALILFYSNFAIKKLQLFLTVIFLINLRLISIFFASSYLRFYFLFEASLIPIRLIVFGWGYQPERLGAAIALLLYTVFASFPLLVIILWLNSYTPSFLGLSLSSLEEINGHTYIIIFVTLGFLVKFPIFSAHLWLPKAHVEAPVTGSIILAALLLKLGGFGLWRLMSTLPKSNILLYLQIFALIGGAYIAFLCLRQTDAKVLIAYSSVSHIRFAIAGLLSLSFSGLVAAIFILLRHGVSSSAIFAGANIIYLNSHSRNILLTSSLLRIVPIFSLCWFLVCLGNMGAPPTINLIAEAWRIIALVSLNFLTFLPLIFSCFLAAAYTLILFASTNHGQTPQTELLSSTQFRQLASILLTHILWLLLMFALIL